MPYRSWRQTSAQTLFLWNLCRAADQIGKFEATSKLWGVRGSLNLKFVKQIQALHQADKPQSLIDNTHTDLAKTKGEHLLNPFLRLKGMWFIGLACLIVSHVQMIMGCMFDLFLFKQGLMGIKIHRSKLSM